MAGAEEMTVTPARNVNLNRRRFLGAASLGIVGGAAGLAALTRERKKALVAISFDLEMSRNFPTWEQTHWDYEKGNLNTETKRYTVEACKRVKDHGGVLHCFAVGQTLEQEDVDWLKDIARAGHPIGNHTYDHVNIKATKPEDLQFRFKRAPWLIEGKTPLEVVRDNIRLATTALKTRAGITPSGFRTPGGFHNGLADRPDLQQLLLDLGFKWVSGKYPAHPMKTPGKEPTREVLDGIVKAQAEAQPFAYPKGLIEVPMSPISDIGAFRGGRWRLEWFIEAIKRALTWVIDNGATFDFLAHPSCMYVVDPHFRTVEMICEMAKKAGDRAGLVSLDSIANRALR
jgi:peptidoglycan/xylan/chitin deacetylase (PgdA/CDA1 family)